MIYRSDRRSARAAGFTLMELMIVVAIVAILAGIAYPSYVSQVAKAKRSEAASALLEAAQALERYYSANGTYLDAGGNLASVYRSTVPESGDTYYNITVVNASANAFTLRATRTGSMMEDGCGNFELSSTGAKSLHKNKGSYTVGDCWRR